MMRLTHMVVLAIGSLVALSADAQMQPSGSFTPGHTVRVQNSAGTIFSDAGGAAGSANTGTGYLTELGITASGTPLCINDTLTSAPSGYHQLCLGANALGGGLISYNAYGATPLDLNFNINGITYPFPGLGNGDVSGPVSTSVGHVALWSNTSGTLLSDSGSPPIAGPSTSTVGDIACWNNSLGTLLEDCPTIAPTHISLSSVIDYNGGPPSSSNTIMYGTPFVFGTATHGNDSLWYLAANDAVDFTGGNNEAFTEFNFLGGYGSNTIGNRNVTNCSLAFTGGAAPGTANTKNYVCRQSFSFASTNNGGSQGEISPTSYQGGLWSNSDVVQLQSGATGWQWISGHEYDVGIQSGASAAVRYGAVVIDLNAGQGDYIDTAFGTGDQTGGGGLGFNCGFCGGSSLGLFGISANGTLVGAAPRLYGDTQYDIPQMMWGLNVQSATYSSGGSPFISPMAEIDPSGNLYGASLTTSGSIGAKTATLTGISIAISRVGEIAAYPGVYPPNNVPTLTIDAPPSGGTQATATVATMKLTSIIAVVSGGASCQTGDVLTESGGTGTDPTITVTVTGGAVTSAVITSPGSLAASSLPSNPATFTGGHCTGNPTFTAGYGVLTFTIGNAGAGYPAFPAPLITATPTSYRAATLKAVMTATVAPLPLTSPLLRKVTTVAGLMACATGTEGLEGFASDLSGATYTFGAAAVGSGTRGGPVFCDGSAWREG